MFFFIFINFLVSFLSDIVLNDLSNKKIIDTGFPIIYSLKDYFKEKSIIISGIYAGLTIAISLIFVMFISNLIFGFNEPKNNYEVAKFLVLSFIPIAILISSIIITLAPLYCWGLAINAYRFGNTKELYFWLAMGVVAFFLALFVLGVL